MPFDVVDVFKQICDDAQTDMRIDTCKLQDGSLADAQVPHQSKLFRHRCTCTVKKKQKHADSYPGSWMKTSLPCKSCFLCSIHSISLGILLQC